MSLRSLGDFDFDDFGDYYDPWDAGGFLDPFGDGYVDPFDNYDLADWTDNVADWDGSDFEEFYHDAPADSWDTPIVAEPGWGLGTDETGAAWGVDSAPAESVAIPQSSSIFSTLKPGDIIKIGSQLLQVFSGVNAQGQTALRGAPITPAQAAQISAMRQQALAASGAPLDLKKFIVPGVALLGLLLLK